MRHRILQAWVGVALMLATALAGHAQSSKQLSNQLPSLGGFTPNGEVSIAFRHDSYAAGTSTLATITISGPQSASGNYTVSVTGPGTSTSIALSVGGAPGSNSGEVTVSIPTTPGEATYTASVTIAGRQCTDSATVHAVEVDHLEYRLDDPGVEDDGEAFTAYTSNLTVPVGTVIVFKAVRNPTDAPSWPQGKPTWKKDGADIGSGETKSVTFNTVSTSATDYKIVSAESGNIPGIEAKVLVVSQSEAVLKLYKDNNGAPGAEISGASPTIGGKVWVALELSVGAGQRVDDAISSVTLQRRELSNLHTDADNHIDKALLMTGNWEKWMGTDWSGSENPRTPNETNQTVKYRSRFLWTTTAPETATNQKLWGHNEDHEVKLLQPLAFEAANGVGQVTSVAVAAKTPSVHNLVITGVTTNAGNPDYFKFNSGAPIGSTLRNPTITFTIADAGDPHRYRWWIWVKPTRGEPNSVEMTGVMDGPGSKTVTINQPEAPDSQDHDLTEWGTYTFEIRVEEIRNDQALGIGEPWQDFRSVKIDMPEHAVEYRSDEDTEIKAQVSYTLQSDRDASSVTVDLCSPTFEKKATLSNPVAPVTAGSHLGLDLYTFADSDSPGVYTAVFMAVDNHANEYRDHNPKRMLAVNQRTASMTPFNIWYDGGTWASLKTHGIGFATIDAYFNSIGINPTLQGATSGTPKTYTGSWVFPYTQLSNTEQTLVKGSENVIVVEYQGGSQGRAIDGVLGQFFRTDNWNLPPSGPGLAVVSPTNATNIYGAGGTGVEDNGEPGGVLPTGLSGGQMQWLLTNIALHEITHGLARGNHCGEWFRNTPMGRLIASDIATPTCVIHASVTSSFDKDMSTLNNVVRQLKNGTRTYNLPWHSIWEINQMRWQLGLGKWTGVGIYTTP